jgi:hypothetical protein
MKEKLEYIATGNQIELWIKNDELSKNFNS